MADDTAHVSKTLDDIRRQVVALLDEARTKLGGMNAVESAFNLPLTQLQDLVANLPSDAAQTIAGAGNAPLPGRLSGGTSKTIRPDTFFADEPMAAAKKYMALVGHAVPFDEIADAIQKGGAAVQGANWRETLEGSLMRSPYEVIKVAEKTYGLASFYSPDQLNRLRTSRRQARGSRGPTTTKKSKGNGKTKKVKPAEAKKQETKAASTPPKKAVATADEHTEPATVDAASEHVH